jgi:hypothetical protein
MYWWGSKEYPVMEKSKKLFEREREIKINVPSI